MSESLRVIGRNERNDRVEKLESLRDSLNDLRNNKGKRFNFIIKDFEESIGKLFYSDPEFLLGNLSAEELLKLKNLLPSEVKEGDVISDEVLYIGTNVLEVYDNSDLGERPYK